ncbi:GlxA family transcriptional regulator [Amycolatopsis suaedae]|uniref:Helix-turn-helix domain-containing protein n=1 Tax=Amycolatopsis suaedae TaxID=2510978 RepID=A0A4Q7JDD7_9PSEU|nr:helix-turn-helix domain-containing protein [Amycolatopsis suaedae]RZQ64643.1 helix-turn-helix domain-containing protein [Amycolatopsis suaedae]
MERTVAILALPRVVALDFSIAANILGDEPGYRLIVCGDLERPQAADRGGVLITPTHDLSAVEEAGVLVVPGYDDPHLPLPPAYLAAIARHAARGGCVVGICTGTFAIAAAGLADGRRVTTHWRYVDELRERYPAARVVENVLFVDDGTLLTSAGGGAGMDVCLHLIRTDFGVAAADRAEKRVVAAPARQPECVDVLTPPGSELAAVRGWALEHLCEPITVQALAERGLMSRRTFIRRFQQETGMPPMRWLTAQRLLRARRLLETSDLPVERVAAETGLGTAENFRTLFRREVGVPPSVYRRRISSR